MYDDAGSDSDDGFDLRQEIARSAFADMCHDWERNQKYDQALQLTIGRLHAAGREAHVLDIGTGSGLLSMMAVRAGADSVVACEAFRPMADCAERVMAANGFGADRIRLIKKRSTEVRVGPGLDMERKANVLVTELFDTELIGEGAIATYRHALEHLLEPGCLTIPHSATVYAQLVECPLAVSWQVPKILGNADGDVLLRTPEDVVDCRGSSAVFDVQLSQLPETSFNALSEPVSVFGFEWSNREELEVKRHSKKPVEIIRGGIPQAVFMWWDLKMDLEGSVLLSCAPFWAHPDFSSLKESNKNPTIPEQNLIPWRDHWMQAIYFLPYTKNTLIPGQRVNLDSFHDEFSLWFGLESPNLPPTHCSCGFHIAYSRSRIGQLNDGLRNKRTLNYLKQILDKSSTVLVIGDGSLLGVAIGALGVSHVYLLEPGQLSRTCMESYIRFNGLKNVSILSDLAELDASQRAAISHVYGEPYFGSAILPWENAIQFGALVKQIRPLLKPEVTFIPHSFSVHAVPVEFLDLHKINAPLGTCEGFDLSAMDRMIEVNPFKISKVTQVLLKAFFQEHSNETDSPVEAQPLWEYPSFALGTPSKLLSLPLSQDLPETQLWQGEFQLTQNPEKCNGIAVWADWHMDGSGSPKTTISTGPLESIAEGEQPIRWNANWRQGVHLVKKAPRDGVVKWSVKFNGQLRACYFQFE